MLWLVSLIKAIKLFFESDFKKPIWIAVTSILFISLFLPSLVSYLSSRPEEQARFEDAMYKRRVEIEDSELMISLYKEIFAERESTIKATSNFNALLDDIRDSGQRIGREQQFKESYRLASEARTQAEDTIPKLEGRSFRVTYLNDLLKGYVGSMQTDVSALKVIQDLSKTYYTDGVQEFDRQFLQSGDRTHSIIREQNTSLAQMDSQSSQMKSAINLNQIELKRALEQNERYHNKGLLLIPAVIFFTLGYGIFFYKGVKRFWKKSSQVSARQKRVISGSKKRRKKR